MSAEVWTTIGLFMFAQLLAFIGFVLSMKGDTKLLKTQMTDVQLALRDLGSVLVSMAEARGRMDRLDDRLLSQGKRLDELLIRFDRTHNRTS